MELVLFFAFIVISFTLITLGLFHTEHTELALVGFVFLFLLSMVLINNDITIKSGTSTLEHYQYGPDDPIEPQLTVVHNITINETYTYESIDLGGTLSHTLGYWLAVCSVIGFLGVILGLRHSKRFN